MGYENKYAIEPNQINRKFFSEVRKNYIEQNIQIVRHTKLNSFVQISLWLVGMRMVLMK